jgi:hypothetical protein
MLHQKTMVADGQWVLIGTTNFDNRSFAHNEETSVCVRDTRLAHQMEQPSWTTCGRANALPSKPGASEDSGEISRGGRVPARARRF